MYKTDEKLFDEIDKLELSENNKNWRAAMKSAGWRVYTDRDKWAVKSWRETQGEDLEIRRAKLLKCVMENVEIKIHDYDEIVGRPTPGVIGCHTAIDVCGDYIPDIWRDSGELSITLDAQTSLSDGDREILRESVRTFGADSMPHRTYSAWRELVGDWAEDAEAAKLKDPSLFNGIIGQTTSTLSWHKIVKTGLNQYISECKAKIDAYIAGKGTDINKIYFWKAAIITLEATIAYAGRYAALAEEMAKTEQDAGKKARLEQIAATCRYVPANAPRTMREALQCMQFCSLAKMLENPSQNNSHWGRADQYLYPFFKRDLENGVPLTELASMLSDMIGRWGTQTFVSDEVNKETHQVNFGINNMMIGGLGQDKTDMSNELSYLFMHLVGLLELSSPTVGLRWNKQTPDWLMQKAIRTNMRTKGGIPLFQNDEIMIDSYIKDGIPYEEAVEWCGLGCVYPCLPTRAEHYGAEGVAAINLAGILHMTLHDGLDINGKQTGLKTGNAESFATFEQLYDAFLCQHKYLSHRVLWLGAVAREMERDCIRLPLLSVLGLEASVELGRDVADPHPDYSMYGMSDRAIIDVADCFTAMIELVYDKKVLSMTELMAALDSNFAGEDGERVRLLCLRCPKYGNDDEKADAMVKRVSEDSARIIREFDNAPFRSMMISREGLAWHYFGGLGAGALPNGRRALEPLNDGSLSPMRGADKNGPTAVLRSACSSGYSDVCYSAVLNQKFTSALLRSEESVGKLISYTNAFMNNNGTHIQYNILDTEQLKDAKAHPEKYPDLIVRIGGFSAYFVQLSPAIQDDVIFRSEFEI